MNFRNATIDDLQEIQSIENVCFPPNEAASLDSFSERLRIFPDHFWLLEDNGQLIGFINGMVTNSETITDEMFVKANLHNNNGRWQSVFGLAVKPEFRKKGYAEKLINHLLQKSREQHRTGVILTCKEYLVPYYEKFGFADLGISKSVHGGQVWHDMVFKF